MDTSNLELSEIEGDLFESKDSLVHCVSRDLRMGKGIAVGFKNRFGKVDELRDQQKDVGCVAYLTDGERKIFYLITKEHYYDKPTMESLRQTLQDLSVLCNAFGINRLSMPRIGCGLDKLNWNLVKKIIQRELVDHGINVSVYKI